MTFFALAFTITCSKSDQEKKCLNSRVNEIKLSSLEVIWFTFDRSTIYSLKMIQSISIYYHDRAFLVPPPDSLVQKLENFLAMIAKYGMISNGSLLNCVSSAFQKDDDLNRRMISSGSISNL